MDILIETTIGDAHVSMRGGKHAPGPSHQIKMAAVFPASGVPNAAEVQAFIKPISNLASTDLDALVASLPATPLPTGYRHFRLFNAMTGSEWHASFVIESHRSLTLHNVVFGALNHPTLELAAWKRTEWLPDMIPGVLDLEIAFATRPRTKRFRKHL